MGRSPQGRLVEFRIRTAPGLGDHHNRSGRSKGQITDPVPKTTARGATPAAKAGRYDPNAIEAKWQARWASQKSNEVDLDKAERPFYNLMMFPYPSAEKLHVGNAYAFTGADVYGRFQRLRGYDVLEPMGFDAFGIHTENYALQVNRHPAQLTAENIPHFREQLKKLGLMLDWSHEVSTCDPEYYRWTQWVFVQLFKAGLAEQREAPVNWCPSCLTVLADEQVINSRCERCEFQVERRMLKQWFLKITHYTQQLLDALDDVDWSEKTKIAQRNWIGRNDGAMIEFKLEGCPCESVRVFTTRPETLCGATFLVAGADHPHLDEFVAPDRQAAIGRWRSSQPRQSAEPDVCVGIDLGTKAAHPLTGQKLPVWAAPYVQGSYGSGVIMGVPAHDQRDWEFARAQNLPILEVIRGGNVDKAAFTEPGSMMNSGDFDGVSSELAARSMVKRLEAYGIGEAHVQYRLRDWLISRQRYWGTPIPIIHCPTCGPVAVPEDQLPVLLPEIEDFRPLGKGVSPLAGLEDWGNVPCPRCDRAARRETDVADTFLDSSWYYLRYPSTDSDDEPFDHHRTWKWLPVNMYIGGHEHAVLHLMYSRFVMRFLYDMGLVSAPEPFEKFRAHGLIVKDGAKMSKSKGNVVNPDEYIARFGADVLRCYLMFLGPYSQGGDFRDDGMRGMQKFVDRVWRLAQQIASGQDDDEEEERQRRRHRLLQHVTEDFEKLHYNTALARIMTFVRDLGHDVTTGGGARRADFETLLFTVAPYTPHLAEELWENLGHTNSIFDARWPDYDPGVAALERVEVAIQVNGKLRARIEVDAGTSAEELERRALEEPNVQRWLDGKQADRVVAVVDRIVSIVAADQS